MEPLRREGAKIPGELRGLKALTEISLAKGGCHQLAFLPPDDPDRIMKAGVMELFSAPHQPARGARSSFQEGTKRNGMILPIVVSLGSVAMLLLVIVVLQESNAKNKVGRLLAERGFQQIEVRTKTFTLSGGTMTFEADYLDRDGTFHRNSCVVHTDMFSAGKVIWEKPLE